MATIIEEKLASLSKEQLIRFAERHDKDAKRKSGVGIISGVASKVKEAELDTFIKAEYQRTDAVNDATTKAILAEVSKVTVRNWGVVQGQLDAKIQSDYVRKHATLDGLMKEIAPKLYDTVRDYAIFSWYNHWTTVLIEDILFKNPNVVPSLKKQRGIDFFYAGIPFDLKVTNLPKSFLENKNEDETDKAFIERTIENPLDLVTWLYENQGEQRFGDDPRFFIILVDAENLEESWKLKRQLGKIRAQTDAFFENPTKILEVPFTFKKKPYQTKAGAVFVTTLPNPP